MITGRAAGAAGISRLLLLLVLAGLLAVIPLLLDDPRRVPHLRHCWPHVAPVDEVVVAGTEELSGERPYAPRKRHAVRTSGLQHAIPEPAQVACQPARPDAGPVRLHRLDRLPGAPLPHHLRGGDARGAR